VNAELTQYSPEELTHQLDLMRQAQITWVRQQFPWEEMEPQPGAFAWEAYDAIVQPFADDPQLRLVAVLVDAPPWAANASDLSPADADAFSTFAAAFASRYGDTVDVYQVWDEP